MRPPEEINVTFLNGQPFVEIKESADRAYRVQFINRSNNYIEYQYPCVSGIEIRNV